MAFLLLAAGLIVLLVEPRREGLNLIFKCLGEAVNRIKGKTIYVDKATAPFRNIAT